MRIRSDQRSLAQDIALGALAGAVATWVMGQLTTYLYEHEDPGARRREDEARRGESAVDAAARKAASAVGVELEAGPRAKVGKAIHWGTGIGAGAVYGALRPRLVMADAAQGAAFGTAFWLAVDEFATVALGLAPGPASFPWQTHVRGLAGHVVFGTVVDTTLDIADRLL